MRKVVGVLLALMLCELLASCEKAQVTTQNVDKIRNFFEKNDVSVTPVYGIYKGTDDYVATVHGFMDNLGSCQLFIKALNSEGTGVYSCVRINSGTLNQ